MRFIVAVLAGAVFGETALWQERTPCPSPRVGTALAYDSGQKLTLLFGGGTSNLPFNSPVVFADTWAWDGVSWRRLAQAGPSGRTGHAIAYDAARGRTVLFGGDNSALLGDTWEWDGA